MGQATIKLLGINFNTDLINRNDGKELNTQNKITRKYGKKMGKRYLTPFGKTTAIKVLFIPAFNQLFITLPSPDQEIPHHINNILFNF